MSYRIERWTQMHAPNSAMMRHILVTEGYRVFQWSDLPEAIYVNHKHAEDQSHWIISGALELKSKIRNFYSQKRATEILCLLKLIIRRASWVKKPVVYLIGEKIK